MASIKEGGGGGKVVCWHFFFFFGSIEHQRAASRRLPLCRACEVDLVLKEGPFFSTPCFLHRCSVGSPGTSEFHFDMFAGAGSHICEAGFPRPQFSMWFLPGSEFEDESQT